MSGQGAQLGSAAFIITITLAHPAPMHLAGLAANKSIKHLIYLAVTGSGLGPSYVKFEPVCIF